MNFFSRSSLEKWLFLSELCLKLMLWISFSIQKHWYSHKICYSNLSNRVLQEGFQRVTMQLVRTTRTKRYSTPVNKLQNSMRHNCPERIMSYHHSVWYHRRKLWKVCRANRKFKVRLWPHLNLKSGGDKETSFKLSFQDNFWTKWEKIMELLSASQVQKLPRYRQGQNEQQSN